MTGKQKVRKKYPQAVSVRLCDWIVYIRRTPKARNNLAWGYNPKEAWRNAANRTEVFWG
jgi:hypothetical protein